MIAPDLLPAAETNLIETYLALGLAVPNAKRLAIEGAVGCTGDFPHPICNFAVCPSAAHVEVGDLRLAAEAHPGFHVYLSIGCGERAGGKLLTRVGFRLVHGLVQMASPCEPEVAPMPVLPEEGLEARLRVARFMMSQFFSRHPDWIRDRVCEATARAIGLDLYGIRSGREFMGAVMLRPSADSVGLYNLCVAGMQRGRGHGSEIVRSVRRFAGGMGLPVILQCNRELEPWYRSLGFAGVGSIEVYALSPSAR